MLLNRGCHLMVALEQAIGDGPGAAANAPGIDTPRLGVLVALDLFGPMRPSEIGMLIGLTSSVVTKLVDRLEQAGYVRRDLGTIAGDRRAVVVTLTRSGRSALRRANAEVRELGLDFVAAMATIDPHADSDPAVGPSTDVVPGDQPITTAPALAELFRFVAEIDKPIAATVGHLSGLHPADPRGLLLLSEIHLRGPVRSGDVAAMIDRSRSAGRHLVDDLIGTGLIRRVSGTMPADRRVVVIDLTPVGHAVIRGVVAAIAWHMPTIRPAAVALSRAIAGERQALGTTSR